MFRSKLPQGFTLMELMITIAIVAVLSAGVITLVGPSSRQSSRDTRREADLQTVASALAFYRNDTGTYPPCQGAAAVCAVSTIVGLTTTYLGAFPVDPMSTTSRQYAYQPHDSGGGACDATAADRCVRYELCAAGEKVTTAVSGCPAAAWCGNFNCSLKVSEP